MKETSSRDTVAYQQGKNAFLGLNSKDCCYQYGSVQYSDWWQGYDDAERKHYDTY